MNATLLAAVKATYGTVSSQTETSGVVAVRNVTARKRLTALADQHGYDVVGHTSVPYPILVKLVARATTTSHE